MFVLVEFNNYYEKSLEKAQKEGFVPVTLFKLVLSDKNQTKKSIEVLRKLNSEIKPEFSAVQIILEKIENSTVATINNLKSEFDIVIGLGGLNKINRFFIEQTQIDFLQDPQNSFFKPKIDFIHHFNSGLNQVLCKAAKDRGIQFLFTLNFSGGKKKNVAKDFGRINQNLKFARKYKIGSLINFIIEKPLLIRSEKEIFGIMSLFDMSTEQKKESVNLLENRIKQNRFKKSVKYISDGIRLSD